jgi:hypothetical protein
MDISSGSVLFREPAFAFACEDETDDNSLPSIVQVAMQALLFQLENDKNDDNEPITGQRRTFQDLTAEGSSITSRMQDDDDDTANTANVNANNATLFAWGADQILQRQPRLLVLGLTKEDVVKAIRLVALNSFTVQGLLDNADTEVLALVLLSSNTTTTTDIDTLQRRQRQRQSAVMDIGRQQPRGIGLYLLASTANHSCALNAHYTFDSQTNAITVQAIHSIKAHEVVTISYGPVGDAPVPERQAALYKSHFFWCHCPACVSETSNTSTDDDNDVDVDDDKTWTLLKRS